MDLSANIEAVLFYRNEPVAVEELAALLAVERGAIEAGLEALSMALSGRGIRVIRTGEKVTLATAPEAAELLLALRKEELTRDLGKAGAETLAIVLYKGPVARSEIDFIRGVNSSFILRNLLIRGLVEKATEGRAVRYAPTADLLAHLGIPSKESLPEYHRTLATLESFVAAREKAAESASAGADAA